MVYTYKSPTHSGFEKFKVKRKEYNKILPNRKKNVFTKIEGYYKEDEILVHYTKTLLGKILITLFLPITIIIHGLGNIKDIAKEYKRLLNQKESGAFVEDFISSTDYNGDPNETFTRLEDIYKKRRRRISFKSD